MVDQRSSCNVLKVHMQTYVNKRKFDNALIIFVGMIFPLVTKLYRTVYLLHVLVINITLSSTFIIFSICNFISLGQTVIRLLTNCLPHFTRGYSGKCNLYLVQNQIMTICKIAYYTFVTTCNCKIITNFFLFC